MATTSKFIQLSSSVLMEYVYADRSLLSTPGNQFRISTVTAPLWRTKNLYTGVPQILNADSAEVIQDGLPVGTANVRNKTFANVSTHRGALLDIDKITFFNDYDANGSTALNMTATASLPIPFTNPKAPVYDTIKLHLVQGFNFEDHQGLTLAVKCKDKDGNGLLLANLSYMRDDLWETLNPSSFFFGGRVYDSYVEVRVLSLYDLVAEYWTGTLDGDTVAERVTNGVGVQRVQSIQVAFSWVRRRETIDEQNYIDLFETKEVDLPLRDQFETIAAYIAPAEEADYIEFYATHNGSIIENYILDLNRSGGDYVVIHQLTVSEYLANPEDGALSWVKTDDLELLQTSDFDLPRVFRPVIRNPTAVAFKIEYVCRLYNRNDNSQVWKTGSMVSYEANKYGRRLKQINLGTNPIQAKVYNKRVTKEFTVNRVAEPILESTRYITSFIDSTQVSVSFQSVTEAQATSTAPRAPGMAEGSSTGRDRVYPNGMARIFIPEAVSYLRFVLRESTSRGDSLLNLHGAGDMALSFSSGRGDEVEIQEFPSLFAARGSGEVIFRLTEAQSKQVLGLSDRTFKLHLVNAKGEKTFVYSGKFFSVDEFQNLAENDRVTGLETTISDQLDSIESLNRLSASQQSRISVLMRQVTGLSATLASDEELVETLRSTIEELSEALEKTQRELAAKGDTTAVDVGKRKPPVKPDKGATSPRSDKGQGFFDQQIARNRTDVSRSGTSPFTPTQTP